MKKLFSILLAILLCTSWTIWTANAEASDVSYEFVELEDGSAMITSFQGSVDTVQILEKIGDRVVTSIGDYAFMGCDTLTTVIIPDSVTSIGSLAFLGCNSLTAFSVSPDHPYYEVVDGVLFEKETHTLLCYPKSKELLEYVVPDGTKHIGLDAFTHAAILTTVSIPGSVETIGEDAFYGIESLTNVVIAPGATSIGANAFAQCAALTSIVIPEGVTQIGERALYWCRSLKEITIPQTVTSIGNQAFSGCLSLKALTLSGNVTEIGDKAFEDCDSDFILTVPRGSYAEEYAQANGIEYTISD